VAIAAVGFWIVVIAKPKAKQSRAACSERAALDRHAFGSR
jgi:hypothetical protein